MSRMIPIEELLPQNRDELQFAQGSQVSGHDPTAFSAEELADILAALPRLLPATIASALRLIGRSLAESRLPETSSATSDALAEAAEEKAAREPADGEPTATGSQSASGTHNIISDAETLISSQLGAPSTRIPVMRTQRTARKNRPNGREGNVLKELRARLAEDHLLVGD